MKGQCRGMRERRQGRWKQWAEWTIEFPGATRRRDAKEQQPQAASSSLLHHRAAALQQLPLGLLLLGRQLCQLGLLLPQRLQHLVPPSARRPPACGRAGEQALKARQCANEQHAATSQHDAPQRSAAQHPPLERVVDVVRHAAQPRGLQPHVAVHQSANQVVVGILWPQGMDGCSTVSCGSRVEQVWRSRHRSALGGAVEQQQRGRRNRHACRRDHAARRTCVRVPFLTFSHSGRSLQRAHRGDVSGAGTTLQHAWQAKIRHTTPCCSNYMQCMHVYECRLAALASTSNTTRQQHRRARPFPQRHAGITHEVAASACGEERTWGKKKGLRKKLPPRKRQGGCKRGHPGLHAGRPVLPCRVACVPGGARRLPARRAAHAAPAAPAAHAALTVFKRDREVLNVQILEVLQRRSRGQREISGVQPTLFPGTPPRPARAAPPRGPAASSCGGTAVVVRWHYSRRRLTW